MARFTVPFSNAMDMTFDESVAHFKNHISRGKKVRTVLKKIAELERFSRWSGPGLSVHQVVGGVDRVVDYLNKGFEAPQKKSTTLPTTATARHQFTAALEELLEWVDNNSMDGAGELVLARASKTIRLTNTFIDKV